MEGYQGGGSSPLHLGLAWREAAGLIPLAGQPWPAEGQLAALMRG